MNKSKTIKFRAFGKFFSLKTVSEPFSTDDSLWRLREIYEPFLATTSLPRTGTSIDIGAGFGCFSLPFASIFPDWKIWCFEPNIDFFMLLCENIEALGLTNIVAINTAVGEARCDISHALQSSIFTENAKAIRRASPQITYYCHTEKSGFLQSRIDPQYLALFDPISVPEVPANALIPLKADFLKLTAPQNETGILETLACNPVSHIVGESWSYIPSNLVNSGDHNARISISMAGTPLRLTRTREGSGRQSGLDFFIPPHLAHFDFMDQVEIALSPLDKDCRVFALHNATDQEQNCSFQSRVSEEKRVRHLIIPCDFSGTYIDFSFEVSNRSHISYIDNKNVTSLNYCQKLLDLTRYSGNGVVIFSPRPPKIKSAKKVSFGHFNYLVGKLDDILDDFHGSQAGIIPIFRRDFLDSQKAQGIVATKASHLIDLGILVEGRTEVDVFFQPGEKRLMRAKRGFKHLFSGHFRQQ